MAVRCPVFTDEVARNLLKEVGVGLFLRPYEIVVDVRIVVKGEVFRLLSAVADVDMHVEGSRPILAVVGNLLFGMCIDCTDALQLLVLRLCCSHATEQHDTGECK